MKNNIITIIIIIVVGMVAFWYINRNPNDTGATITSSVQSSDSVDAQYIYNTLKQMEAVTLDDKIFSNPVFQNLKDNTASFTSQPVGRNNPFAQIGTDTVFPTQTVKAVTPAPSLVR